MGAKVKREGFHAGGKESGVSICGGYWQGAGRGGVGKLKMECDI